MNVGRRGIYGASGTGKSTFAKGLVRIASNVVVFDPLDEYSRPCRLDRLETDHAVARVLTDAREAGQGVRLAWVPARARDRAQALSWLSHWCMWFQSARRAPALTLLVEELQLSYPVTALPADCQGFTDVCLRGRHYNIDVIGVTQRPAMIGTNFRGNESESYFFRTHGGRDLASASDTIGSEHRERLRTLADHNFLHFRQGRVSLRENLLT